ncbi:MAG: CoA transferase [Dehalococcoidia bacterium]|nr:MAG: CoA transferase [Dehalococcoidia bacterium]
MTSEERPAPLEGIRVLDAATILAGPLTAMLLGDFGAEVIKIEHPRGDSLRTHGYTKNGHGLWWKVVSRNKRTITLNFSHPEGQALLLKLVERADVFIENFRPGTLEKWNLGPDRLHAVNPRLVILRTTGFGQFGPYAQRPGFGTLAESMSGFAAITGDPNGPPTLPPFGLADGIAGIAGAYAVMLALYHRDARGGTGQVIDLAIIEPILTVLGPQPIVYDQLGIIQQRSGNRSVNNAPRNIYRTRDGKWVAISTSAQNVAERVMRLVGHPEVIAEPWFKSGTERAQHADLLDEYVGGWIAQHDLDEVLRKFEEAEAAVAPVYDIADIFRDPQYQVLNSIITVPNEDLGPVKMQNVLFRLSETPGRIRWAGRRLGRDNAEVYGELGLTAEQLAELQAKGVI